ncbi:MAG: BMP family lipoprotein [Erysipelotrichaceae bacterium]
MKKLLNVALVGVLAATLVTGCSNSGSKECAVNVGLVTDLGGIDDKSFNEGTWNGVLAFADEQGLSKDCYAFQQSNAEADYIPNLSQFADDFAGNEKSLVVAPGFLFETAMGDVADQYPDQKFLIIDSVVDRANVASATFAEQEGSYLVGIAAGLVAKEAGQTKLGFIGGMDFELINRFEVGFIAGVLEVYPEAEIMIEYANDFGAPEKGKTLAAKMYDAGAYIIFHAAGGTGNGLIEEAKARREAGKDVWAIGVDSDQYAAGEMADGSSAVLTSMLKRVDLAAKAIAEDVLNGEFKGGEVSVFNLANEGVGAELSTGRNLSDAVIASVQDYATKGKAGELNIPADRAGLKEVNAAMYETLKGKYPELYK